MPFSVYGIPLLGLAGLLICLWHPQVSMEVTGRGAGHACGLVQPSPRLDRSMTVFLKQEAKDVAYSRRHDSPAQRRQKSWPTTI